MQLICKRFRNCLAQPYLRKELRINNNSQIFCELHAVNHKANFTKILVASTQLRVLSLKYCPHVNKDILNMINNNCNPFTLTELYLDGCENISDEALDCLKLTEQEIELNVIFEQHGNELFVKEEE